MRARIAEPTSQTRVASSPMLSAPWSSAAAAAARFAATARPLPTVFRTPMVAHALSSRLPAPRRLHALVQSLHGRLSVVNPTRAARLPVGLATAVHGLVRLGFDVTRLIANDAREETGLDPSARGDSHVRGTDLRRTYELRLVRALLTSLQPQIRERLSEGLSWAALALYESSAPSVCLVESGHSGNGSASAVAVAEIGYRLVIFTGSGMPESWQVLDRAAAVTPAVAWPPRHRSNSPAKDNDRSPAWFVAPLLVPDVWLSAHADPTTLAQWASLTGRSGAPDRYWFPETWDRFLEPGRRVGWLTANDVWRPRRGRLPAAVSPRADDEEHEGPPANRYGAMTLTPDLERGVGVPPGYALIQCVGTLDVVVVVSR